MSSDVKSSPNPDSTNQSRKKLALGLLLVGGIAIGCSPILVRQSELGPISSAFWRVIFAFIPLLLINRVQRPGNRMFAEISTLNDFFKAGLPGVFLAGDLMCWHLSLHMTTVANSTLLVNSAPIFVAIAGWLFLKQPVQKSVVIGLIIALTGVIILKGGIPKFDDANLAGDSMAIVAALFLSCYMIVMANARKTYSTLTVMIASTASTAIIILPVAVLTEPQLIPSTLYGWGIVITMGWISHALGQGLIAYSLAWLPAAFSSLTLLIQPVIAAVLALWILSESLSIWQVMGGLLILLGIFLARRAT